MAGGKQNIIPLLSFSAWPSGLNNMPVSTWCFFVPFRYLGILESSSQSKYFCWSAVKRTDSRQELQFIQKEKNHSMIYFSSILSSLHQHSAVSSNARIRKFCSLNAFSVLQRAVLWLTGPSCPIQFPDSNFQHRSQKKRENKIVFRSFGLIFHFLPTTKCKIGQGLSNHTGTAKWFHLCIK